MRLYQPSREEVRTDYREDELFVTIEVLRSKLLEVAQERSFSDHAVLELSQRLDSYIVLAQNKMMENLRSRKTTNSQMMRGQALMQ